MSAVYSIYTSPNHAPIPNHLPTLIVTPYGQPHHTLYSYIHTSFNRETYLLTPSPQGDLCVAKMVPPPGSRGPGGPGHSDPGHGADPHRDRSVRCEASRNLKWSITNTGIHAPVYKLTLPNPDVPGSEQPLFQISKPNPNATWWTLFYFTYAGHLIPPKRIEFGKIQKNAASGSSSSGGGGTRVSITGKSPEEKAVWQTLGEGNEDMVEWIVLCAALNVLDEEIIKAAEKSGLTRPQGGGAGGGAPARAVPSSRPGPTLSQRPGPAPAPFQNQGGRSNSVPGHGGGPPDPRGYAQHQQQQQHYAQRPPPPQGYPQGGGGGGRGAPMSHGQQQPQSYGPGPQAGGYGRPPPQQQQGGGAGGYGQRGPPPPQSAGNGRHF
ncbi:hypothetical protein IE81DRAFT_344275 [Ceraceosorus guamensis]|uniref:Uncharacterized protein n=1 Tax=Ceraceosorus guamensis TaxID=1522189 RepID=A0A316W761_9BASI|nr:hypothetical protein IE81DRAFT_344275 [Ceraceosorus guamensis]PWN45786.1 hypothetical protein IE81DRAFT_344275 [Ceraceosorus guamensis]